MEPNKPPSVKKEDEKEKQNKDNTTPPSQENCPQDPKEKGSAPKCQGCPYRQQCLQAAKSTGPSIDEQVKKN